MKMLRRTLAIVPYYVGLTLWVIALHIDPTLDRDV